MRSIKVGLQNIIDSAIRSSPKIHFLIRSTPKHTDLIANRFIRGFIKSGHMLTSALAHPRLFLSPKSMVIPSVDLIVTTRCTLRCDGCGNYIPYFGTGASSPPGHIDLKDLIRTVDLFLDVVDRIAVLCLSGGEPLMHPDLVEILIKLCDSPKVKRIVIPTNGTLIPDSSQALALSNPKILLNITDYGRLSSKKDALITSCRQNGIVYKLIQHEFWRDHGDNRFRGRTDEEREREYTFCRSRLSKALHADNFYACPHGPYRDRLEWIPVTAGGSEERVNISLGPKSEIRNRIRNIYRLRSIAACNFCDGSLSAERIDPPGSAAEPK